MGEMLSQEEIDALLKSTASDDENMDITSEELSEELDDAEKDALGEIGNISMGTSATTLFSLVGQKVTITTPKISIITIEELAKQYPIPFVAVEVKYKEGFEGTNLLILKEKDVKIITDLMMGGNGTNHPDELTELHLSAISEAMNQMVGSAATSLSEMFQKKIDIYPPKAFAMDFSSQIIDLKILDPQDKVVKVGFKMLVGDIIDSEIMQIIPMKFAKGMVENLFKSNDMNYNKSNEDFSNHSSTHAMDSSLNQETNHTHIDHTGQENNDPSKIERNDPVQAAPIQVQPAVFQSFDESTVHQEKKNINIIKDVPLEVTVELGRTIKKINEILEFSPGTVIELDKLVGEPLDILINGQFVAKGEVVVIDENYGIRIIDITSPANIQKE